MLCHLEQFGSNAGIWTHLEPYGAIWSQLDPNGTIWTQLDLSTAILKHLDPFEAIFEPFGAICNDLELYEDI